jgi:hypothetical protein
MASGKFDWTNPADYELGIALKALLIGVVKRDAGGAADAWTGGLDLSRFDISEGKLRIFVKAMKSTDGRPTLGIFLDPRPINGAGEKGSDGD